MPLSFSFKGIKKKYFYIEKGRRKSIMAPLNRVFLLFPGMPGAYLSSTETEVRVIKQPFFIKAKDIFELKKLEEDMAEWLVSESPEELVFDDEPDRVYYAVVQGSIETDDEAKNFGRGVITFVCPDPFKFGNIEHTIDMPSNSYAEIEYKGTAPTYPTIIAEVLQPITMLDIITKDAYMRIGEPVEVGGSPVAPQTRLLWTECNTLLGWANASEVPGATVNGVLKTDGTWFFSDDYGVGTQWHGPAMKTSLTESVQDFSLEVVLQQISRIPQDIGRVTVALLDESNKVVATLQMWKRNQYVDRNWALFSVHDTNGSETIFHQTSPHWNDFYGMLRISRKDKEWSVYVGKIDRATGQHHTRDGVTSWIDGEGRFTNKVRQVLVHVGTHTDKPATSQRIDDIKVYRLNNTAEQVPFIAQAGDKIEFDFKKSNILLNGESITDIKSMGASYFPLVSGINPIMMAPPEAIHAQLKYRDAYK